MNEHNSRLNGIGARDIGRKIKHAFRALLRGILAPRSDSSGGFQSGVRPNLSVYWDEKFADDVSAWGRGNAWDEIRFLMAGRRGRVLDVACGTGINISELSEDHRLEVHGCDISDLLIRRARERGIPPERVRVCDATQMPYDDEFFDYGYSIGSLEHFDVAGLERCIKECRRVIKGPVFHMVPVSRDGVDQGWVRRQQSFHNNSVEWWRARFAVAHPTVTALDSRWNDDISVGKWFVCQGPEDA